MANRRLLTYDAFSKTVEDARIRTTSGGILTIVSSIIVILLVISEWRDYTRLEWRPEIIVDKTRGDKMEINVNITFPNLPCGLITMDAMDASGEIQEEISSTITKTRLDENGKLISSWQIQKESIEQQKIKQQREQGAAQAGNSAYCGSCYGARPDGECCNSCGEVRKAYSEKGWAFHDGKGIQQCEEEHYTDKLEQSKNEGCNIAGRVYVNKVVGDLHFAPGASITHEQTHTHDMSFYLQNDMPFNFAHHIHHLSFGQPPPPNAASATAPYAAEPLSGSQQLTESKTERYQYFIKVVATRIESWGQDAIETNQYSVTSHQRSILGGADDDHPHTLHSRGGVPGVYFSYDISPIKVISRQERTKSFATFLTGLCAIVGGVVTIFAIVDRGVWEADKALRRKKNL